MENFNIFKAIVKKSLQKTTTFPSPQWGEGVRRTGEGLIRCKDAKRHRGEASIVKLFPLLGEGLRERVNLEDMLLQLTETGDQEGRMSGYLRKKLSPRPLRERAKFLSERM